MGGRRSSIARRSPPGRRRRSRRTRCRTRSRTGSPAREVDANPALAPLRPTLDAAVADVVHDWRFPARFHDGALGHATMSCSAGGSVSSRSRAAAPPSRRRSRPAPTRARCSRRTIRSSSTLGGGRLETGLVNAAPWARGSPAVGRSRCSRASRCSSRRVARAGAPARRALGGAGRGVRRRRRSSWRRRPRARSCCSDLRHEPRRRRGARDLGRVHRRPAALGAGRGRARAGGGRRLRAGRARRLAADRGADRLALRRAGTDRPGGRAARARRAAAVDARGAARPRGWSPPPACWSSPPPPRSCGFPSRVRDLSSRSAWSWGIGRAAVD